MHAELIPLHVAGNPLHAGSDVYKRRTEQDTSVDYEALINKIERENEFQCKYTMHQSLLHVSVYTDS